MKREDFVKGTKEVFETFNDPVNIVSCSWVQGNISASRSVEPALKYLRSKGIDCNYNDGWMD